jgi:hypothetical protein
LRSSRIESTSQSRRLAVLSSMIFVIDLSFVSGGGDAARAEWCYVGDGSSLPP